MLEEIHLVEKLVSFDRECIPEQVVHARDTGAYGEFVSSGNFTEFTKASLFQKGKITPVFVRFSTGVHGIGSPETLRDPKGFVTKFYTDEGNYDLAGNNLAVFLFVMPSNSQIWFMHLSHLQSITNKMQTEFLIFLVMHQKVPIC